MAKLVTIGIPVYKRLNYLPHVLNVVAAQDYPHLELLVSDNGMNGAKVHEIVKENYSRPNRIRQNAVTVDMSVHFNQIIHDASGDYFVLLADDDEISSNYVSELVNLLERHGEANVAMGIQETMDENGVLIRKSSDQLPELTPGPDFIRALWRSHEYRYESVSTFLARRKSLIACGGFPDFWKGSGNDDMLMVKLCVNNFVALTARCAFRKRSYETSHGYAMTSQDLARAIRDVLRFLDSDPMLLQFACDQPAKWRETRHILVDMAWKTYYFRWADMYKQRMSPLSWTKAAFALPFLPEYYKNVGKTLIGAAASAASSGVKKYLPWAYEIYRSMTAKRL